METTKSFKVGDKFEHSKLIYEIRESSSCKGCSFFIEEENHCDLPSSFPCSCNYFKRLEHKNVIFVQVGEVSDESEIKSKYDGLVIKQVSKSNSSFIDCELCCMNNSGCEGCPLKSGFYFAQPVPDSEDNSRMSERDKLKVLEVIRDLSWIAGYLKSSLDLNCVFKSSIDMSISDLELQLQRLSFIKTFDNK